MFGDMSAKGRVAIFFSWVVQMYICCLRSVSELPAKKISKANCRQDRHPKMLKNSAIFKEWGMNVTAKNFRASSNKWNEFLNNQDQHHYIRGFHQHTSKIHRPSKYSFTAQNGPGIFARAPAAAGHPFAGFRVVLRQKKNCPHWIKLFKSPRLAISARLFLRESKLTFFALYGLTSRLCLLSPSIYGYQTYKCKKGSGRRQFFFCNSPSLHSDAGGHYSLFGEIKGEYFLFAPNAGKGCMHFFPISFKSFFPLPPSSPTPSLGKEEKSDLTLYVVAKVEFKSISAVFPQKTNLNIW